MNRPVACTIAYANSPTDARIKSCVEARPSLGRAGGAARPDLRVPPVRKVA